MESNYERIKREKDVFKKKITALLIEFEEEFGGNVVEEIRIIRWNGSNNAFGDVIDTDLKIKI